MNTHFRFLELPTELQDMVLKEFCKTDLVPILPVDQDLLLLQNFRWADVRWLCNVYVEQSHPDPNLRLTSSSTNEQLLKLSNLVQFCKPVTVVCVCHQNDFGGYAELQPLSQLFNLSRQGDVAWRSYGGESIHKCAIRHTTHMIQKNLDAFAVKCPGSAKQIQIARKNLDQYVKSTMLKFRKNKQNLKIHIRLLLAGSWNQPQHITRRIRGLRELAGYHTGQYYPFKESGLSFAVIVVSPTQDQQDNIRALCPPEGEEEVLEWDLATEVELELMSKRPARKEHASRF